MTPTPISRRAMLRTTTAIGAGALAAPHALAFPAFHRPLPAAAAPRNRAPLAPQPFQLLPTGAITPAGWLRRQLEIQARGMGGRLDEIWPDVGPNSGWLGGDGESWERGPYFVDGLLPLAWQLGDPALKAKAQKFINWTLDHPWPSGMLGPRGNNDWWPRMVMLKALTQYHELTGDPRVIPAMQRHFRNQLAEMPGRPLEVWGKFRWQDEVLSVIWLYNRTGEAWLLDLARLLKAQGFDWQGLFADYPYREKVTLASIGMDVPDTPGERPNGLKDPALTVHGVNNAMGLKTSPVWSVISGEAADRRAIFRQLDALDRYHGLPIGIYSADEHLAGRSPSQGVELCAIVEAMFSLEHALAITGEAALGDRIERLAYNALPATFTDDMWAHQYDQQPNQVQCSVAKGPWTTNGPEANLFGLEPHFGCCTANFHQGWPKLVSSLWMASDDDGLAATLYGPCEVTARLRDVPVRIRETTDYPFRHDIALAIDPDRPVAFPLRLRIPGWATAARIRINGADHPASTAPGGFARIERRWQKGDRVDIAFTSSPRAVPGYNGSISFEDGPLVFALPIDERWDKLRDHGLTADWQVFPESAWRYAVAADAPLSRIERSAGAVPFSRRGPPVVLVTEGRPIADWPVVDGAAAPVPAGPTPAGPPQRLVLMPYAAPKLRLTSFPALAPGQAG